jgi:hypothetical protein
MAFCARGDVREVAGAWVAGVSEAVVDQVEAALADEGAQERRGRGEGVEAEHDRGIERAARKGTRVAEIGGLKGAEVGDGATGGEVASGVNERRKGVEAVDAAADVGGNLDRDSALAAGKVEDAVVGANAVIGEKARRGAGHAAKGGEAGEERGEVRAESARGVEGGRDL